MEGRSASMTGGDGEVAAIAFRGSCRSSSDRNANELTCLG